MESEEAVHTKGVNDQPVIFISFTEDSDSHVQMCNELAAFLSQNNCKVNYANSCRLDIAREGRDTWTVQRTENANFVLMICTQNYKKIASGDCEKGHLLELDILRCRLRQTLNYSISIPILFAGNDEDCIPLFVGQAVSYRFPMQSQNLLYHIYRVSPLELKGACQ